MPVPAGVSLVTLNITPPNGVSVDGLRVRAVPTWRGLHWTANGQALGTMIDSPRRGIVTLKVPATNQNGFANGDDQPAKDWSYVLTVDGSIAGVPFHSTRLVQPLTTDGTLYFDVVSNGGGSFTLPARLAEAALDARYASISGTDARRVWSVDPAVAGSSYTPAQRTAYFHALLAAITAAGGSNVIEFPAVEFVIALTNTTPSLSGSTRLFVVPSGTSLLFRPGTKFTIADADAAASNSVLVWQLGADTAAASNFLVQDGTFAHKAKANTKSFWGVGNRRSDAAAKADNVSYERNVFDDVTVGVTNARRNPGATLGTNRDTNWRAINNDFRICNNRAIELSQLLGGLIQGNTFTDVESAIHLLLWAENIRVRDNRGTVRTSGLHINANVKNCEFEGGRFDFIPGVASNYGALHFHTEPDITSYETSGLRFGNYYFGKPTTGATQKSMSFMTTEECTAAKWRDLRFSRCTFEGAVAPSPFYTKPGHEASDFVFTDCDFYGDLTTVASSVHNVHDWRFVNCRFHAVTGITVNADRMFFHGCEFAATPTIAASSAQSEMINCVAPAAIVNNSGSSTVTGTTVRPSPQLNPSALANATVWDANDLTVGVFTTWAPKTGSAEAAAFAPVAGAPEVVANAVGAHKAVRFTGTSGHRLLSTDFAAAKAQPMTLAYLWKDTDTAADQLLVSGKTNNQIVSRHVANGQVAHRANAAGSPIQPATVRAFGAWHCTVVVYNGASSKTFTDGVAGQSGTLTEVEPLAALRIGSTGSGSATGTFNGDWQYLALIPKALSDAEVAGVLRWMGARGGVSIG